MAGLAGCATPVFNRATNEPLSAATPPNMGARMDFMRENSIVLSFSGGGLRAAAFAHGVLTALQGVKTAEGDLLDDVALISSVSGSSLTAAHYGLYGREGLERFRSEVLLTNFERGMRLSLLSPVNLMRMLGGGLNVRENFDDTLDRKVFRGATFADIFRREGPDIRIQATDLYHRVPFPFFPPLFSLIGSDLSRFSVADAVAASMAVPVIFAPIVVRTYPDTCVPLPAEIPSILPRPDGSRALNSIAKAIAAYRDPKHGRFIKLADGGLTDNFAVSTLVMSRLAYGTPYAPMTVRDAVRIRRLLLIVVDASHGPHGDWTHQEAGPGSVDLALSAINAAVDSAARHAVDAVGRMIQEWQESVIGVELLRCEVLTGPSLRRGPRKPPARADRRGPDPPHARGRTGGRCHRRRSQRHPCAWPLAHLHARKSPFLSIALAGRLSLELRNEGTARRPGRGIFAKHDLHRKRVIARIAFDADPDQRSTVEVRFNHV